MNLRDLGCLMLLFILCDMLGMALYGLFLLLVQ